NFKELINPEKTYVVSFWATWCVPCKKELNNIKDLYPEWVKNFNVELIAVSTDDSRNKAKIKTYTSAENWAYRVVLDQNQDLMKAFGVQQIPFTMIINKGKVVYTHNSYQEGDEYELENQLNSLK
ncbi:MAG: TlpA family protein disulfide reductase, partial [Chitinophagales bacterium]|nr:TlpA family protein disulfide reductase [Chitinophagales bacterium]